MQRNAKILLAGGLLFLAWYLNFSKSGRTVSGNIGSKLVNTIMNPTRGERNNNPGNIVKSTISWQGLSAYQPDSHFARFVDPVAGIRALSKVLITYYTKYGLNTVEKIVNRWAPPIENNTGAYVDAVSQSMGVSSTQPLNLNDPATLENLVTAIIKHENGRVSYDIATIQNGVNLALG